MTFLLEMARAFVAVFGIVGSAILNFIVTGFQILFIVGTTTVAADGTLTFTAATGENAGVTNFGLFCFAVLGLSIVIGLTRWLTSLVRRKI